MSGFAGDIRKKSYHDGNVNHMRLELKHKRRLSVSSASSTHEKNSSASTCSSSHYSHLDFGVSTLSRLLLLI